jgi:hypothetical protein
MGLVFTAAGGGRDRSGGVLTAGLKLPARGRGAGSGRLLGPASSSPSLHPLSESPSPSPSPLPLPPLLVLLRRRL